MQRVRRVWGRVQAAAKSRDFWLGWLTLAWLPLLLILLFVAETNIFNTWTGLTSFYLVRRSITALGLGLILFGPAVLFGRRLRYTWLLMMSLLSAIVFAGQLLYYNFSGSFLQASVIRYIGNATDVSGTAGKVATPEIWFFVAPVVVVIVAYLLVADRRARRLGWRGRIVTAAAILVAGTALCSYVVVKDIQRWGDASRIFANPFDSADLIRKVGITAYSGLDLHRYLASQRSLTPAEKSELAAWSAGRPQPRPGTVLHGAAAGRNVIFIQLESYERFVIGLRVNGQEVTPNLNRLVGQGLDLSNYYYQIGPGNTADAEFTTLTSLYPLSDRVAFFDAAQDHYDSVLTEVQKHGYHTYSLHSDVPTFWNRSAIYPNLGYQQFVSKASYVQDDDFNWGLSDDSFFRQSAAKLAKLPGPYYASVITLSTHSPFTIPAQDQTITVPNSLGLTPLQHDYIVAAHYTDAALGQFIQELQANGTLAHSMLVIDGDHQPFIAKPTDAGLAKLIGHDWSDPYQYLKDLQVPLIIYAPGTAIQGRVTAPASHLDLMSTILNLLGFTPPKSALGQDVLNTAAPVVTKRRSAQEIEAVITSKVIYQNEQDGDFNHGTCRSFTTLARLPLTDCRSDYDRQLTALRMSDMAVEGNALELLKK